MARPVLHGIMKRAVRGSDRREFGRHMRRRTDKLEGVYIMKCTLKLIALGAVVLAIGLSPVFALIGSSAHDFQVAWSNGEICAPCHTPHNATGLTGAPLWSRADPGSSYTAYPSGGTMDATDAGAAPGGASLLCLSCHDGTVALGLFQGGNAETTDMGDVGTGSGDFGLNLSNDHPISITYNTALSVTDTGLNDPATTVSGLPGGGFITGDLLFSNKVECASCHDVHNTATIDKLLVKSNAGSALCLTCHNK